MSPYLFFYKDNIVESIKYNLIYKVTQNKTYSINGMYELLLGEQLYHACTIVSKVISKYQ
jgi:hypothetical protein